MILSEQFRPTQAIVDQAAIAANVRVLKKWVGSQNFLCPMVKANGYGHGDRAISQVLEQEKVDAIGVNLVEEGIHVREARYRGALLYFGCTDRHGLQACTEWAITPVLANWESLETWLELHKGKSSKVHIKFDTGMNRLGFSPSDAILLREVLLDNPGMQLAGIMTHLHSAEGARESWQDQTWLQLEAFYAAAEVLDPTHQAPRHGYNSAGLIGAQQLVQKSSTKNIPAWVQQIGARPGLSLYGVAPHDDGEGRDLGLQPVMSLNSRLVQVKKIFKGEGVSYGHRFRAGQDMWIGLVPVGYADGIKRGFSPTGRVFIADQVCPVIGQVCMDFLMVSLMAIKEAGESLLGSEVTFFGYTSKGKWTQSVEQVARQAGVIPWELITGISERVPRHFVGDVV